MSEGRSGSFDAGATRPYENRPLPPEKVDSLLYRMGGPVRLDSIADQLRQSDVLREQGRRLIFALPPGGGIEDALVDVDAGRTLPLMSGGLRHARNIEDLRLAGLFPVDRIEPGEIDRICAETRIRGNLGYFDASEVAGFKLGVVFPEEHTKTEISWVDPHDPRGPHGHH